MADIVALITDRVLRARLADALRGRSRLVFCDRVDQVREAVAVMGAAGAGIGAVILEPRDCDGIPADALVPALRSQVPAAPVLAYCSPAATASGDILAMARAGVSGLLLRGYDDVGTALRSALATASDECAARLVLRVLTPALPSPARVVVEHCLLHGREPLTVTGVAHALGVNRKTLVLRMAAAKLPQPRALIAWARLCLVAHALDQGSLTIERAAMDFGYPSAPALRNLCKRLTGLRLGEVRENGGLACMLHLFTRALGHAETPAPRPA